jgi:hypothetical protein
MFVIVSPCPCYFQFHARLETLLGNEREHGNTVKIYLFCYPLNLKLVHKYQTQMEVLDNEKIIAYCMMCSEKHGVKLIVEIIG